MIYFFLFITLTFIIYSELSITNILLRPNSNGSISFNFNSLFHFLINPLFNKTLWSFKTLDINYIFILLFSYFIYYLV